MQAGQAATDMCPAEVHLMQPAVICFEIVDFRCTGSRHISPRLAFRRKSVAFPSFRFNRWLRLVRNLHSLHHLGPCPEALALSIAQLDCHRPFEASTDSPGALFAMDNTQL